MELRPKISTLVTGLNFPEAPCFDSRGKLWFTEIKSSCLTYFDDGKLSRVVAGGNTNGMVFDASGDIWFTDSQNHKLRKYRCGLRIVVGLGA